MDETFVNLAEFIPSIHLDLRYATPNNFLGRAVYDEPLALLVRPAAEALRAAQADFADDGLGLVIWDAYRPFPVTRLFWDEVAPEHRGFVADPSRGSVHNRGCAVDVTLRELDSGAYLDMPTPFDEFSPRAYVSYQELEPSVRDHRDRLIATMGRHGLEVIAHEWWHFNLAGHDEFAVRDETPRALLERQASPD